MLKLMGSTESQHYHNEEESIFTSKEDDDKGKGSDNEDVVHQASLDGKVMLERGLVQTYPY